LRRTLSVPAVILLAALSLAVGMCHGKSEGDRPSPGTSGGGDTGGARDAGTGGMHTEAGAGGARDGSAAGTPGLSIEQNWVTDQTRWTRLGAAAFVEPACTVYEGIPDRIGFPDLEWQPCGDACEAIEVGQADADGLLTPLGISLVQDGDRSVPIATFRGGFTIGTVARGFVRVVRLDTGQTVAALKDESQTGLELSACSVGGSDQDARHLTVLGGTQGSPKGQSSHLAGFAPVERGAWTWAVPERAAGDPSCFDQFDIDPRDGEGTTFCIGFGTVQKQRTLESSEFDVLENPSESHVGWGQGDLAIWTDYALGDVRVQGWTNDGDGVRTIVEVPPVGTCRVTLSPMAMVAVSGTGMLDDPRYPCQGVYDEARLWRSARAYDAAGANVAEGPPIPLTPLLVEDKLETWGDFAGFQAWMGSYSGQSFNPTGQAFLLVARLSTWQMYRVRPTPGSVLNRMRAISEEYLYFGEAEEQPSGSARLRRIVRVPLESLERYGELLE
jgi:hypothetical protein